MRRAEDGWHGIWRVDGVTHQFWLHDSVPDAPTSFAVALPMDTFLELRAHAARRLWRALNGRMPGPEFRAMPAQLRQFHILSLRALDARLREVSYRKIAEVLLGFRGRKEDWESDPRKSRTRRLVEHAFRMMRGGHRLLLHYPIKLPKR
uniref:T6SS Transcription factor RovC-like DNA binding domain-containing protein n=1 Tax=Chelativorans sp. (strain BNC1) TaxID=266779 RepID=Q11FU9_CHESB